MTGIATRRMINWAEKFKPGERGTKRWRDEDLRVPILPNPTNTLPLLRYFAATHRLSYTFNLFEELKLAWYFKYVLSRTGEDPKGHNWAARATNTPPACLSLPHPPTPNLPSTSRRSSKTRGAFGVGASCVVASTHRTNNLNTKKKKKLRNKETWLSTRMPIRRMSQT